MPGGDENRGKESRKEKGGKIKKKERKETKKGKKWSKVRDVFWTREEERQEEGQEEKSPEVSRRTPITPSTVAEQNSQQQLCIVYCVAHFL